VPKIAKLRLYLLKFVKVIQRKLGFVFSGHGVFVT